MDNKYIENLGMVSDIDEGFVNTMKARAASLAQGYHNIRSKGKKSGVNIGTPESAKFKSLFSGFITKVTSLIKEFDPVILPWKKYAIPAEKDQINAIKTLYSALNSINLSKLPITEAMPFASLGVRARGGVQNILDYYKKQIASACGQFKIDIAMLNINPDEYLKKIADRNAEVNSVFNALTPIIGQSIIKKPAPPAIPVSTATDTTASTDTASPVAPPAEEKPVSRPGDSYKPDQKDTSTAQQKYDLYIKSGYTPAKALKNTQMNYPDFSGPAAQAPHVNNPTEAKKVYELAKQTLEIITKEMAPKSPPAPAPVEIKEAEGDGEDETESDSSTAPDAKIDSLPMPKKIQSYYSRNANNALAVFEERAESGNTTWNIRWRFVKKIEGNSIDIRATEGEKSSLWTPFITYSADDIYKQEVATEFLPNFDTMALIKRTNYKIFNFIKEWETQSEPFLKEADNKKLQEVFSDILIARLPDNDRGARIFNKNKSDTALRDPAVSPETTPPIPPASPSSGEEDAGRSAASSSSDKSSTVPLVDKSKITKASAKTVEKKPSTSSSNPPDAELAIKKIAHANKILKTHGVNADPFTELNKVVAFFDELGTGERTPTSVKAAYDKAMARSSKPVKRGKKIEEGKITYKDFFS